MPDGRGLRRRETERAIVSSATTLFLERGYARTTLSAVAEHAGVSARTVYVHFDSKVRLFQRVVEVATVGDLDEATLPARAWSRRAMTAATFDERVDAFAEGVSDMHERLGPLMAVNGEVETSEPSVQESAAAARAATVAFLEAFWRSAHADGLLPAEADVEWLIDTSVVLSAAETRLLISRHLGWDRDRFRDWIVTTWWRLRDAGV